MTTALVTGSRGFVGSHLRPLLRSMGWTVVGVGRSDAQAEAGERYLRADVTMPDEMAGVLEAVRPDVVFHLAAGSAQTVVDPVELVRGAVSGTQSICSSLRRVGLRARLILAGSSAQYGATSARTDRLVESDPCEPLNTYGYAKAAAESVAFALSIDSAFELVAVRPFNHVGPGERPTTVAGAIARRVLSVVEGRAARIPVGDLGAVRDFTDARDIARGYVTLAERGVPGSVYNLCSGRGRTVGDVLDGLLDAAGLDRSVVDVVEGSSGAIASQVGSPLRTEAATGWVATIPLDQSLSDLLGSLGGEEAGRWMEGSISGA